MKEVFEKNLQKVTLPNQEYEAPTEMKSPYLEKSAEIIYRELKGIISESDYTGFSAKKNEGEKRALASGIKEITRNFIENLRK